MNTSRKILSTGFPIIHISDAVYKKISEKLIENIDGKERYDGKVEYDNCAFFGELDITLLAYYEKHIAPDGEFSVLTDVQPIWVDFRTWLDGEEEIHPNDFDISKFKKHCLA